MAKRANKENESPNSSHKKPKPFFENKRSFDPILSIELKSLCLDKNCEDQDSDNYLNLGERDINTPLFKEAEATSADKLEDSINLQAMEAIKNFDSKTLASLVKMKSFNPKFCYNEKGNSLLYLVTQLTEDRMEMASILLLAGCSLNNKDIECLDEELQKNRGGDDSLSATVSVREEEGNTFPDFEFFSSLDSYRDSVANEDEEFMYNYN